MSDQISCFLIMIERGDEAMWLGHGGSYVSEPDDARSFDTQEAAEQVAAALPSEFNATIDVVYEGDVEGIERADAWFSGDINPRELDLSSPDDCEDEPEFPAENEWLLLCVDTGTGEVGYVGEMNKQSWGVSWEVYDSAQCATHWPKRADCLAAKARLLEDNEGRGLLFIEFQWSKS